MILRFVLILAIVCSGLRPSRAIAFERPNKNSNIWATVLRKAISSLDFAKLSRLRINPQHIAGNPEDRFLLSLEWSISQLDNDILDQILELTNSDVKAEVPDMTEIQVVLELLVGGNSFPQIEKKNGIAKTLEVLTLVDMTDEIFSEIKRRYPKVIDAVSTPSSINEAQMGTLAALHFLRQASAVSASPLQKAVALLMTYGLMGLYRDKIQGGLQKEFGSIIEGKSILESVVNAGGTLQLPQVIVEQQKQLANTVSAFLQWEDGVTNAEEIKAAGEFMQYYQALQTNALACVIERAIKDKLPAVKYCENISEIEFPPEKLSLFQKVKKTAFFFGGATMAAALPYVLNADIYGLSFRSEFFMFLGSAALSLVGFVTLTVMSIDRERAPGKRDALSALHYLGISDPRTFHTEMAQAMMAPAVKRCEALLEEKVQSVRALPGASR